jgi:serine/threonine protein kinase/WD40 repeat protein
MNPDRLAIARGLVASLLAIDRGDVKREALIAALRAWCEGDGPGSPLDHLAAVAGLDLVRRASLEIEAERFLAIAPEPDSPGTAETVAYRAGPAGRRSAADASRGLEPEPEEEARFEVVRTHARGGLGEVFVAIDRALNRTVALKELTPGRVDDPEARARFRLEAELTGRLEHPGIVPVYALGQHRDGRPFYTMRFVEGETLGQAIARFHAHAPAGSSRSKPRPAEPGWEGDEEDGGRHVVAFRRLLGSVVDACNAVAFAHSRAVVHRDLKPDNIMVGRFGETLVVDWGVAKRLDAMTGDESPGAPAIASPDDAAMTRPGALVGTPRYMSPEQAAGDLGRVGPASDVYGLGAILYEVLTGRAPYPEGDVASVLKRARKGLFASPRRVRREVDPALESICLRAMAREPSDRFATALEMAGAIEAWLADARYRGEQARALGEARTSHARLSLERAHQALDRGAQAEGLLWLARALEQAGAEDPDDLARVVRCNLTAWALGPKRLERVLRHPARVASLAFDPEGRRLVACCDGGAARIWDVSGGTTLAEIAAPLAASPAAPVFRPDGAAVATADADAVVRTWDAADGRPLARLDVGAAGIGPILALAYLAEGRILAILGRAGFALWDEAATRVATWGDRYETPPRPPVVAVAVSSRAGRLALAREGGGIDLIDGPTGRPLATARGPGADATSLAFDPAGRRLLVGDGDGTAWVWDPKAETEAASGPVVVSVSHAAAIRCVAWRPGGEAFATACAGGSTRLWDAASGRPVGEPITTVGPVADLGLHGDGRILATAGPDGHVRLWCARTGLAVGPPMEPGGARHAAITPASRAIFSPDGRRLAAGGTDGVVRLWHVPEPVMGSAERVDCWIRSSTGVELDPGGAARPLDGPAAWDLRRRLMELGGAPLR